MQTQSHVDPSTARERATSLGTVAAIYYEKVCSDASVELDLLSSFSLSHAEVAAAAGEVVELPNRLRIVAQSSAALFSLARAGGSAIDVPLVNCGLLHLRGDVPESSVHGGVWLDGMWSALATRDLQSTFLLAATPSALLRESSSRGDEHLYRLVDALRSYVTDGPDLITLIADALEATDPGLPSIAGVDYGLYVRTRELEVLLALSDEDADAFGDALVRAVVDHREYWTAPERRDNPSGAIALGLLALAAEAHDRGIAFDLLSPYLPVEVLEQPGSETVVACAYCLTPIAEGTVICPACLEDVRRDALIEYPSGEYRKLERRPCGSCGFRVATQAVRCPSCRMRI